MKVLYEVNNEIEEALFPRLFPGSESMPNTSAVADSLQAMTTHEDVFKMKLLMYLISAVFAPTTSLRPSNKCFPILVNDPCLLLPVFSLRFFRFDFRRGKLFCPEILCGAGESEKREEYELV